MTLEEKIAIVTAYGYRAEDAQVWYLKWLRKKHTSPARGIAFELSFEQYLSKAIQVGIDEPSEIRIGAGGFVLGRVGDNGNYTPNNCRFITTEQNTSESVENGRYGVAGSKKVGRTKENHTGTATQAAKLSKAFILRDPNGIVHCGSNVKEFCLANNLNVFAVYDVFAGRRPHHKGWTGSYQ